MTENMKKFLEDISKHESLSDKLKSTGKEEIIAAAKELGIELTDADFAQPDELSEDELNAVAGGSGCFCLFAGGASKDKKQEEETCGCVLYGEGDYDGGMQRCICVVVGDGL